MKLGAEVIRIGGACAGEGNCIHYNVNDTDEIVLCRSSKKRCQFFEPRNDNLAVCICGHGINFHKTSIAIVTGDCIQIVSQEAGSNESPIDIKTEDALPSKIMSSVEMFQLLQGKFQDWTNASSDTPTEIIIATPFIDENFLEMLSNHFSSEVCGHLKLKLALYFRKKGLPEISKFAANKFLLGCAHVQPYVENSTVFNANFIAAKFQHHVELLVLSANMTADHLSMGKEGDKIVNYNTVSIEKISKEAFVQRFQTCLDLCTAEFFLDAPAVSSARDAEQEQLLSEESSSGSTASKVSAAASIAQDTDATIAARKKVTVSASVKKEGQSATNAFCFGSSAPVSAPPAGSTVSPASAANLPTNTFPTFKFGTTTAAAPPSFGSSFLFGATPPTPSVTAPAAVRITTTSNTTPANIPVATAVTATPVPPTAVDVQALQQRVLAPLSAARSQQVNETCPSCHRSLTVRTNRSTGEQFIGCTGFTSGCRYTKSL